jgi:hypothetical protein
MCASRARAEISCTLHSENAVRGTIPVYAKGGARSCASAEDDTAGERFAARQRVGIKHADKVLVTWLPAKRESIIL